MSAPHGTSFKLKKAIYGLKESALIWNRKINKILKELGFCRSINDFCLYMSKSENKAEKCFLIYLDDISVGGN